MFKHILIPTDGSRLALKGAKAGVKLAAGLGARVTAVYVINLLPAVYGEVAVYVPSAKEYRQAAERTAKKALAAVQAKMGCACPAPPSSPPILSPGAASCACALQEMRRHRARLARPRRARRLILGSETVRVLAHLKIPVLVTR